MKESSTQNNGKIKHYLIELRQLLVCRKPFRFSFYTNARWGKKLNLLKSNLEKPKETVLKSVLLIFTFLEERRFHKISKTKYIKVFDDINFKFVYLKNSQGNYIY
jgi:hypothetical protein